MKILYKKILITLFKFFFSNLNLQKESDKKNFYLFKMFKLSKFKIKIFKIRNCRLFTNTHDVAVIKNNLILNGPSLQIRNNLNSSLKKNFVAINGTPKVYKRINGRVYSLLTGMDSNNNYYHWFFDCLPKIYMFKKFFKFSKKDFFLVPNIKHSYQRESLKILGIKKILNAYDIKHFFFKELIITNFTNFNDNPPIEIIKFIRKSFIKSVSKKISINKIFLNRTGKSSIHRDIFNKKTIIEILKKKDFKIIDPSNLNLKKQIKYFNQAKFICGVHGAAFTNIVFCKKNTKVIEFLIKNSKNKTIKNIAKKLNLNFKSISFNRVKNSTNKKKWDGYFKIPKSKLLKILN